MNPQEIPNFEVLCDLLKEWDKNPDDSSFIQEMLSIEGYEEWLDWMEKNRPDELP